MWRTVSGVALLALSGLMLLGFLSSSATLGSPATLAALAVTVLLPAVGGGALLTHRLRWERKLTGRRDTLRRQTVESELLRLASQHGGRLTHVEVVRELGISSEAAQEGLDALVLREVADLAVTDAGTIVYTFHDIERLPDKSGARPILE